MDFLKSEQGAVSHFVKIKYVDKKIKEEIFVSFLQFLTTQQFRFADKYHELTIE